MGVLILILNIFYQRFSTSWQYNVLLTTKFIGSIISGLLLWQSIDKNNPFIQTLCQAGGKMSDCNNILSSKAAQFTDWLSWSEIGFFYFASSFLALIINPLSIVPLCGLELFLYFTPFGQFTIKVL